MYQAKRIVFLGAGFETPNMGVSVLISGAITSALHSFPDAVVYLFDYGKQPARYVVKHEGRTSDVELVNIRFSKKIFLQNNIARLLLTAFFLKMIPLNWLKMKLLNGNPYLKVIAEADIVGSISGGDSFSDIYGLGRFVYIALPQILVILLNVPLIVLPQTLGPFRGLIAKTVARYILGHARMVYSRDYEGLKWAKKFLARIGTRLEFCYDMGFVLEPQIAEKHIPRSIINLDRNISLIGLNVSGLLYIGGYTQNNMFGIKADYRRLVHDLIDYFVQKHNAHVMLVPHVFGPDGKNSESDMTACREIFRETAPGIQGHLHFINEEYNQYELKALIARSEFFIGSRMHACIAALSQFIPAVGLAYSEKFRGVFGSIGMEDLVINLCEHDGSSVIALIDRLYQRRTDLRVQLAAKIPTVKASVLDLFTQAPTGPARKFDRDRAKSHG